MLTMSVVDMLTFKKDLISLGKLAILRLANSICLQHLLIQHYNLAASSA